MNKKYKILYSLNIELTLNKGKSTVSYELLIVKNFVNKKIQIINFWQTFFRNLITKTRVKELG